MTDLRDQMIPAHSGPPEDFIVLTKRVTVGEGWSTVDAGLDTSQTELAVLADGTRFPTGVTPSGGAELKVLAGLVKDGSDVAISAGGFATLLDAICSINVRDRVLIAGVPRAGKTTLAGDVEKLLDLAPDAVLHTDDLIGEYEWSELSLEVSERMSRPDGPRLVEGVAAVRAVRKWMDRHPDEDPPVDVVVFLGKSRETLTKGQAGMAKGCWTIWEPLRPRLVRHGVTIIEELDPAI